MADASFDVCRTFAESLLSLWLMMMGTFDLDQLR
jgi:hypothetical protein